MTRIATSDSATPAAGIETPQTPQTLPTPARAHGRRRAYRYLFGALVTLFLVACYIGVFGGNLRVVDSGKLYRSSQLTGNGYEAISARAVGNSLDTVIDKYHIKTLLNLRGGSMNDLRYRDEVNICKAHGVAHIDDGFSARALPSPEVMTKLLNTFDGAKYPILVHCQAGSDRTGLACTVYANIYMKQPLDQAEGSQLTWRYGHFGFTKTRPMDQFFELYRKNGHGLTLREWIRKEYPAIYATGTHG